MNKLIALLLILSSVAHGAGVAVIPNDTLKLGKSTAADKTLRFNTNGGAADPIIKWNNSTSKLQFSNDGTIFSNFGSGSGSGGGLNYIAESDGNPGAENNTAGWTTYDDGAAVPVDGSGGTVAGTWTRSTSTPLRGDASFLWTPNTSGIGEGVAYPFTIHEADKAKVLQISADYALSGTITDGDYSLYIYDVTNSRIIQPDVYKFSGTSGTTYNFKATFQTASDSTSYKILIHQTVNNPGSAAVTLKVDNVSVGPQILVSGAAVTAWRSYTPTITGAGTATNVNFLWRQVGDSYQVSGTFTTGTTAASLASVTLPGGASLATQTITNTTGNPGPQVGMYSNNPTTQIGGIVTATGTSSSVVYFSNPWPGTQATLVPANGNSIWTSTTVVAVNFTVQIAGLSSTSVLSNDADTRVVAATASGSSTSVLTTDTTIVPTTITKDTHGGFNGSGVYTVKISGFYQGLVYLQLGNTSNSSLTLRYQVNSDSAVQFSQQQVTSAFLSCTGSFGVYLNAGDTLKILGAAGTTTTTAGSYQLSLFRLSGPATIAASESVTLRYLNNSGQTITNSGARVVLTGWTKDYDDTNSFNPTTGYFTAPISGKYRFTGYVKASSAAWTAGNFLSLNIQKNSSSSSGDQPGLGDIYPPSVTDFISVSGSNTMRMLAGDTMNFTVRNNRSGGSITLAGTGEDTYMTIERVGNY